MKLEDVKKVEQEEAYSLKEVAKYMGINYMKLFRMVKEGKIEAVNKAMFGNKPIYGITAKKLQEYYDQIQNTTSGVEVLDQQDILRDSLESPEGEERQNI